MHGTSKMTANFEDPLCLIQAIDYFIT